MVVVVVVVVVVVDVVNGASVSPIVVVDCSALDPSGKTIPPDSVVSSSSVTPPTSLVTLTLPPSLRTQYWSYSLTCNVWRVGRVGTKDSFRYWSYTIKFHPSEKGCNREVQLSYPYEETISE